MSNDICQQFDPYRGDLLYGFAADRGELQNHLNAYPMGCPLRRFFDAGYDQILITVDYINDSLFGGDTLFQGGKGKIQQKAAAITDDWVTEFWQQISAHRFSPLEAFNTPYEKRNKEGWNDLANDRYYLAIRRGCKFGFEYILNSVISPDAKIHFLLDRFDRNNGERMVQAVKKEASTARGRTAVSITYSEIRYVYRNWDRLRNRVLFYYNFDKDEAPWEDDGRFALWNDVGGNHVESYKDLWAMYGSARKDKLLAMINKGKVSCAANYNSHRADVDRLVQEANGLDAEAQCAKYEQALALLQPDRKRWRELRT
jgi:hypothetical protein